MTHDGRNSIADSPDAMVAAEAPPTVAGKTTLTSRIVIQRKSVPGVACGSPSGLAGSQSAAQPTLRDPADETFIIGVHSASPVQRKADTSSSGSEYGVHEIAARGVAGASSPLPHVDRIAKSFGPEHEPTVRGIHAQVGGDAAVSARAIGADAYATRDLIGFASGPDLHTAAHEAAHVVQQRAGVHLKGGVGDAGDSYERQADAVADRVVAGEDAADLLAPAVSERASSVVQRQAAREPVPSGQQILDAGPTDPGTVADPVALVDMMKNEIDGIALAQQGRAKRAIELIKLPDPEEKMSLLDRLLLEAITVTVGLLTDGLSDLIFAGAEGAIAHEAGEAGTGVVDEIVHNSAKNLVKVGPEKVGDVMKESAADNMKGDKRDEPIDDGGREMSLQELLIEYDAQVYAKIADRITNAKNNIDANRAKWEKRPVQELQARVRELVQIAARQTLQYDHAVMMGWMDLRARLSTAHKAARGQPETMMPEANQPEQKGSLEQWWNANPGFINIYFSTPAHVFGVEDLAIERVTINAEKRIVKELREANLSLGDLPVPRRVRFDSVDGKGGLAPGVDAPWFVITAAGGIEVAPGPAHRVLSMIGSGRGGSADELQDSASQTTGGSAVADANAGILHAQDLAAAMRGARLVRDRLRAYTTRYMIPEE